MNQFDTLLMLPNDPIYGLQEEYKNDPRDNKLNLSIGILVDSSSKPYAFSSIQKAIHDVMSKPCSFGYLAIDGYGPFRECVKNMFNTSNKASSIYVSQTIGGTGALYIALQLLHRAGVSHVAISNPTWPNHKQMLETMPFTIVDYPYKGKNTFDKTLDALRTLPSDTSAIILHATCHNPTGIDLSSEELHSILQIAQQKNIFIVFDAAYLGLAKSIEEDILELQTCMQLHDKILIAVSFAKNCGLYNERPGALVTLVRESEYEKVVRNSKNIIRTTYSSPSAFGVKAIATMLMQPDLHTEWNAELKRVRAELKEKRHMLAEMLNQRGLRFLCTKLEQTKGLFSLFELSESEITALKVHSGVYLSLDGRINIAGLKLDQISYFVDELEKHISLKRL